MHLGVISKGEITPLTQLSHSHTYK